MNNLSESFAAMGKLEEAKQWAERGLELAENPNTAKVNKDAPVCNESCGVLLYNMGMLHEVKKKITNLFVTLLLFAKAWSFLTANG